MSRQVETDVRSGPPAQGESPLGILRQFAGRRRPLETCELCSHEIHHDHPHLLEIATRKLLCSCEGCALLFSSQTHARYKRIPRHIYLLRNFQLSDVEWDTLMIPINMAFFFKSSLTSDVSVLYPSPAGATESMLALDTWNDLVSKNPAVAEMESDVEALLVNRVGHERNSGSDEYYLLPIDECYRLTGLIRLHWRGLSGGAEVWQEIAKFFDHLRKAAIVLEGESHA